MASMEVEEEGSMEAGSWMLTPCAAGTKRKAVARCSYKEGDQPPEGWIDLYKQAEPASSDPSESQRRAVAIDKMLDTKLPVAAPVAATQAVVPGGGIKLKRRLTKGEIKSIIALKPEPFPSADYLDELAQFEPAEVIAEKRRQHEADAAYFGDRDEKYEAFRQQVIKGLEEDGYYEVDEDYIAAREKSNQRAIKNARVPFSWMDPADLEGRFATPEEEQQRLREGSYRRYVPDAEDALLISYGDDDDVPMSDDEDSDYLSGEEEEDAAAQ